MKKLKFLLLAGCLAWQCCVEIQVTHGCIFSKETYDKADQMYSGDKSPQNRLAPHTYVYLCRTKAREEGCSCHSCNSERDGLCVGVITTAGPFSELDTNSTQNLVWSSISGFTIRSGWTKYEFRYTSSEDYFLKRENGLQEQNTDEYDHTYEHGQITDQFRVPSFPKLLDSFLDSETKGIHLYRSLYGFEEGTPCAKQILNNALFCWEIKPSTISDVLTKIGTTRSFRHKILKNILKRYNCASVANQVLHALVGIPLCTPKRSLGSISLHIAAHVGIGLITGMITKRLTIGVLAGSVTGAFDWIVNHDQLSQDQLIEQILGYQKKLARTQDQQKERIGNDIAGSFRIIAHKKEALSHEEPRLPQNISMNDLKEVCLRCRFSYENGDDFEYKTADDAIQASVTVPGRDGKFLLEDFGLTPTQDETA